MKRLCIALFVCVAFASQAQTSDEKAVSAVVENLRQAMVDGNRDALSRLSMDQLSYGHSSGLVEDKATFVENIASGHSDFVTIQISDQSISIVNDVAIVRHKLLGETVNNGTPGKLNLSVLLIWKKTKGEWKLLARQATKLS